MLGSGGGGGGSLYTNKVSIAYFSSIADTTNFRLAETASSALMIYGQSQKEVFHRILVRNETDHDVYDVVVSLTQTPGPDGSRMLPSLDRISGAAYNNDQANPQFTIAKLPRGQSVPIEFRTIAETTIADDLMVNIAKIESARESNLTGVGSKAFVYYKVSGPTGPVSISSGGGGAPEGPVEKIHHLPKTGSTAVLSVFFITLALAFALRRRFSHFVS